jgi:co-chaperonin GroES (HSP10)
MKLGTKRIAVKPEEVASVSDAGLVIPDGSRERPDQGTVIAAGGFSMWSVGDTVHFPKHLGFSTEDADGNPIVVLWEDDILFSS